MTHTTSLPEETRGLDRRSVVKAAAWAAPVIAVAVAAPIASASTNIVAGFFGPGSSANAANPNAVAVGANGTLLAIDNGQPILPPDTVLPTGAITVTITVPYGYELDTSALPLGWIVQSHTGQVYELVHAQGLVNGGDNFSLTLTANRVDPQAPAITKDNRVTVDIATVNYSGSTTTVPNR